jgi:tripartite-type tricarboxylate transporter receptor subunit TctC
MKRNILGTLLSVVLLVPTLALAQAYPTRPVRVIVPYAAGGNTDSIARIVSDSLSHALAQQFVVENRPGAGGAISAEFVAKAPADGYTLYVSAQGVVAMLPNIQKVSFDPLKDFSPISNLGTNPLVLGVHQSTGAKTLKEFIDFARSQPGKLSYASGGNGSISHFAAAMLVERAGLNMTHIPYKGGAPAVADLVAGQVHMYFGNFSDMVPHAKSGRITLLGVSSEKRDKKLPDLPAIAETLPGFVSGTWNGLLAPAGTPPAIIERLSAECQKAMKDPVAIERLAKMGVDAYGSTPAEFAHTIRKDFEMYRDAAKAIGITPG